MTQQIAPQPPENTPRAPASLSYQPRHHGQQRASFPEGLRLSLPWLPLRALTAVLAVAVVVGVTAWTQVAHGQLARKHDRLVGPAVSSPIAPTARAAPSGGAAKGAGTSGRVDRSRMVVGVGDSVTSGYRCNCDSFVELYASQLAASRHLTTSSVNLGVPGLTSSELLQDMTQPGSDRDQVAKADILLVTVGANDLGPLESEGPADCPAACYMPLVERVGNNVELIVKAARDAHPNHPPTVLVTDYWNVFQDGDVGTAERGSVFTSWSDALTRAESTQICHGARRAGATCVSLYAPFKGDGSMNPTSLLAADGDHPNAAGHQAIASALLGATPRPLAN
jgi:lysophospholipase L1-like esterase